VVDGILCPDLAAGPPTDAQQTECDDKALGETCNCGRGPAFFDSCEGVCAGSAEGPASCVETCQGWKLLDYDRNFCALGLEQGDVINFDRFTPREAELEACAGFYDIDDASFDDREPLRYVVRDVGAHRLILSPDHRRSFSQARRSPSIPLPSISAPRSSPSAECAVRLLSYQARVGNDEWVLTGGSTGYRHPWVDDGGQCVRSSARSARVGRTRLGDSFVGEWFDFRLGAFEPGYLCSEESGENCDPHMIDVSFQFRLVTGEATRRLSGEFIMPQDVRWLPANDHLYVVDGAAATVFELSGLDIFQPGAFRLLRRFD
jgi:hypothetical protein